jgi:hypothetical protein
MTDFCHCPPEAGSAVCELSAPAAKAPAGAAGACPACGAQGKPVQGQTVRALLSVSLRAAPDGEYRFCRTPACPVVYFSAGSGPAFTVEQVRERVYQKEPDADDVLVCYCFRHTAGAVRAAAPEGRAAIVTDINAGIQAGQCACDLRNPQGSCCLGNVNRLIRLLEQPAIAE